MTEKRYYVYRTASEDLWAADSWDKWRRHCLLPKYMLPWLKWEMGDVYVDENFQRVESQESRV